MIFVIIESRVLLPQLELLWSKNENMETQFKIEEITSSSLISKNRIISFNIVQGFKQQCQQKNSLENHENVVPTLYSANTWQMYFPPPILCISPKWLLLLQRKQKWYYLEAFFLTSQSSLYTVIQTTSQCSIREFKGSKKRNLASLRPLF